MLPHPPVPGYVELNMRLGWNVTKIIQLSLSGFNLLYAQHQEFLQPGVSAEIPRSFLARWASGFDHPISGEYLRESRRRT
jgi:hypothetical protein